MLCLCTTPVSRDGKLFARAEVGEVRIAQDLGVAIGRSGGVPRMESQSSDVLPRTTVNKALVSLSQENLA